MLDIQNKLTQEMIEELDQPFSEEEVYNILINTNPMAAHGPDDAIFYQTFWHTIGTYLTKTILHILNENNFPNKINDAYICLIPKISNPKSPSDYRPIALCNVLFKVSIKTTDNRIKKFLPNIITEN